MLKRRWPWIVAVLLLAGSAATLYLLYWRPRSQLRDLDWLGTASPEEQRQVAHRVLRFPGDHHDAFILLEKCGTRESIPFLIEALWWQSEEEDLMTCERACALRALRRISGVNPGTRYGDWKGWWESCR